MSAEREEVFDDITNAIGGVRAELLMPVWPKAVQVLRRAVRPETGYTLDAVLTELQTGHMQLWVINDFQGVVVTQIKVLPLHKVLWVMFLAGDHMDDWLDDWIQVQEEYARFNNCVAVEFSGRKGWQKIAERRRGYKPTWTIFRRELGDG
jgi:8-oxo-dGTP pyrophosphatase MutT (NUDIX family)